MVSQRHSTRRDEVGAARRQMGELLVQDSLREHHVVQLEQALAEARKLAHRDELTELPNRRLLLNDFNRAVARGARQRKQVGV